uniref:Uncharacterized protein n=1 Tax=Ralstonia solanacearum TaxID=305 RepID=A0A0S4WVH5_RALSL|nr:conserved exported protein of unknown function [Ralstonia solanacearum]
MTRWHVALSLGAVRVPCKAVSQPARTL